MKLVTTGFLFVAMLAAPMLVSAADITATLESHKGQRVSLRVAGGEEITGKVAAVDSETVHLTDLAGREFFDAVVALDDVSAVVFRVKGK